LDFLATFVCFGCCETEYWSGEGCKRILAKRLRDETNFAYRAAMRNFVIRWLTTTVAVMTAAAFINGIRYDSAASLIGAALLLGILNAFVRPVLLILGAPLILLTLGFFILIVNGLMLYWVPSLVGGFHVDGFGSAFWGAILIGIVSWLLSAFFRGSDGRVHVLTHHTQIKQVQGRVIEPGDRIQ
jgi:putative membrane protein